jgi:hypothetical protein
MVLFITASFVLLLGPKWIRLKNPFFSALVALSVGVVITSFYLIYKNAKKKIKDPGDKTYHNLLTVENNKNKHDIEFKHCKSYLDLGDDKNLKDSFD